MKTIAKYYLLFSLLWTAKAVSQFQGFDILLPTIANQIQTIQSGDYVAQNMITVKPIGAEEVHLSPLVAGADQVHLYIDPSIVIPFPYSSNSNSTGTPPVTDIIRTLDFNLPVGKTQSSYNLSMVGSLNYNIPISAAPGTKGIEPKISINYNSLNTNGLAGYGWSIAGIESITRLSQTIYHNNNIKSVSLSNDDWFAYNGNRLVTVFGQNGANNSQYRTESESFIKVTSYNSVGNGPEWFKVETKEGMTLEFGNTTDSRLVPVGQNTVLSWMINKIEDNFGNYMSFKYHNSNGENYIEEINYTGNPNANILPYNQLKFYYDSRPDQQTAFVAGGKTKSTVILREIEAFSEGISFKKYDFIYSYNNVFSFLNEVIERGTDRTNYNSLLFSYQDDDNGSNPLPQTASLNASDPFFKIYIPADVNEDGKSDLLRLSVNDPTDPQPWKTWSIFQNLGNSQFSSTHSSTFPAQDFIRLGFYPFNKTDRGNMFFENLDFDGDGKEDLVFLVPVPPASPTTMGTITLHFYLSSNNYAPSQTTLDALGDDPKNIWFLDFNGDQKLDLINLSNLPSNGSSIHNGQAVSRTTVEGWLDIANGVPGTPDLMAIFYGSVPNTSGGTYNFRDAFISDVDGDGKAEIMNISEVLNPSSRFILRYESASNPAALISDNSGLNYEPGVYNPTTDCLGSNDMNFIGDYNGDLKTDVLTYNRFGSGSSFTWAINFGKGDGTYENVAISNSLFTDPFVVCGVRHLARDLNYDGKTDILEYRHDENTSDLYINIYFSEGVSFLKETHSVQVPYSDYTLNFGDFNGDGSQDLIIYSQFDVTKSPQIVYLNKGVRSKFLKQAVDGYNVKTEFEINPISSIGVYGQTITKTYPLNNLNGPLYVLTKLTRPDGVGGDNVTSYSYEDVIIHKRGKGLVGFLKTTEFNNVTNFQTINEYDYDATFFNLIPLKTTTNLLVGQIATPITQVSYTVNTNPLGGIRHLPALANSLNEDFISGKSIKTDMAYDLFGNILTKTLNTNAGYEVETTTNSYIQVGSWIPSRLSQIQSSVVRGSQSPYLRSTSYFYNTQDKGEITSMQTDVGVKTEFLYNAAIGVLSKKTVFAPNNLNISQRITNYLSYDPYFRFATKVSNSLNQITEFSFDNKWGKLLSEKGVDGLTTQNSYDPFGRALQTVTPDNLVSTSIYSWVIPGSIPSNDPIDVSDILFSVANQKAGQPESIVFYDSFERERKTQVDGFTDKVYTVTGYDERFNIAVKSGPYQTFPGNSFNPVLTTYSYDNLNRLIKTEQSNGVIPQPITTQYSYSYGSGNTTIVVTEPDGIVKSKTNDPTGVLINSSDNGGTLIYDYFSNRKIKSASLGGIPLKSYTYDAFGRQNSATDVNSGITTYQYNEFEQLISQTDANNHTYSVEYDVMGRVIQKTGPDGIYSYQYITNGNGINKLLQATAPNGIYNKYFYDALNREIKIEKNINSQVFSTSFAYDNSNNLTFITYPSGFSVKRDYNNIGHLLKVSRGDNNQSIWKADEMNPLGLYSKYTLGNGLQTMKNYSDFGLSESIIAGSIQNIQYNINPANGNVNSRTDAIVGLTESFSYDQTNRLTNSNISGSQTTSQTIGYAANGNITQKTDAGSYSYLNNKPNAIESVTNVNGDISSLQQAIVYTSFSKVQTVIEGDYQLSLIYSCDQQRAKSDLFYQGSLISSKYFVGNYEKQVTPGNIQEIHYINGGDGLAAIYVIENGVGTMYYVYKDNLGSILSLTDQLGNKIAEQNFDAWGRQRNPSNWTFSSVPSIPSWLYRGFTGHEHLPSFALINMNGRVYDPILGMMLSPDPVLADNTNTQAYNGYAYAFNNPLKYIDKDGKCPICIVVAIGAVVGGIANVVSHWDAIQGSESPWLAGTAAFGIGATAGALSTLATIGAGPTGGIIAGFITGALAAGLSSAILQIGNNQVFGDPYQTTEQNISTMMAGGILGGILGGYAAGMDNRNIWTGKAVVEPQYIPPREITKIYDPDLKGRQEITVSNPSGAGIISETEGVTYNVQTKPDLYVNKIEYIDPETGVMVKIDRTTIAGYKESALKTDLYHNFPKELDDPIINGSGWAQRIKDYQNGGKIGYWYESPGYIQQGNKIQYGTYQIGINQDGFIFHRFFKPF